MTRFIIVRHGDTKGTVRHRYYGRTDMPLTKEGRDNVKKLSRRINRMYSIDCIYTSPLKRCLITADIFRGRKNIPVNVREDIIEIDFGKWEGLTLNGIYARNPRLCRIWMDDFLNTKMPGGERVRDMAGRVRRFWREAVKRHKEGNILITSHGGPVKVMLLEAAEVSIKNFWRIHIDTASASIVEADNGVCTVKGINLWGE